MEEGLLIRYLNGECTPEEAQKVRDWLQMPGSREKLDTIFEKYWFNTKGKSLPSADYDYLLNRIHHKVGVHRKKHKSLILWSKAMRVAANIALILFSAFFLREGLLYHKNNPEESQVKASRNIVRVTGPGEKLNLKMSDGTKIILNSQSEISFSMPFGRDQRLVNLKGEAFFDIAPDSLRPFRVQTDELITTALGTQFNVMARGETFKVALTQGRVKVGQLSEGVELSPGQMALWDSKKKEESPIVTRFNQERVTAWKEGKLMFDRKPLGNILRNLETWYGVEMRIDPELDMDRKVIGTFQNKNLKDILTGLSFSTGFEFQIRGKIVTIKNNVPMT
ncbi:FecR family protein [Pleomorphovibrio marinus]|uniref:FecR family protein n=1 Tax=Pleomorphovibrio marinus TaxID=2164132 RepID=UPI000E0B82E4|nr:FecR domain-containing protein [Pleomorphovibrio marinus]